MVFNVPLLDQSLLGCLNNNPVFMLVFRALVIVKFRKFFIRLAAYNLIFLMYCVMHLLDCLRSMTVYQKT